MHTCSRSKRVIFYVHGYIKTLTSLLACLNISNICQLSAVVCHHHSLPSHERQDLELSPRAHSAVAQRRLGVIYTACDVIIIGNPLAFTAGLLLYVFIGDAY